MHLAEVFRRRWKWLAPLTVLVPAAVFSSTLMQTYYHWFEKPALQNPAQPGSRVHRPGEFASSLPSKAPKYFEFVVVEAGPNTRVREAYYFEDSSRLTLESIDGKWKSSSSSCLTRQWAGDLSMLGMALLGVTVLAHAIRTRQFFWFPGMKTHAMNDFEIVVGFYALTTIAAGFLGLTTSSCDALGAI